ncbi:MAG TPA: hypothetical protein VGA37_12135 [Gemmatimonadales bacterium]
MNSSGLRRVLHGSSGALVLLVAWSETAWRLTLVALAVVALVVEGTRLRIPAVRSWLDRAVPVYREVEGHQPSGALWLAVGYALAAGFPVPAATAGVLAAAWADPAASLIGARWGRGETKSAAGSVTALAVATGCIALTGAGWWVSAVGGVAAAALERWSPPLDDNLVIAPGVAAIVWLVA